MYKSQSFCGYENGSDKEDVGCVRHQLGLPVDLMLVDH